MTSIDPLLLSALGRVHGFRHLGEEARLALAAVMKRANFRSGSKIFRQGAMGQTMYFVADGLLRAEYETPSGRSTALGGIRPGEFVGEMALLDPAPRSATVVAATDAVLFGLDRDRFAALQRTTPLASSAIVRVVLHTMSQRMARLDETLAKTFGPNSLPQRSPPTDPSEPDESDEPEAFLSRLWVRLTGGD